MAANGVSQLGVAAFHAGAHGVMGGVSSVYSGGSFGSGFLSGAVSSGIASQSGAIGIRGLGMIGVSGLSGGFTSSLAGGSFWEGFRNGIISGALNHAIHQIDHRLSMRRASEQEIIDHFFDALNEKNACFDCGDDYSPVNLEGYFKGFPEENGTHIRYIC